MDVVRRKLLLVTIGTKRVKSYPVLCEHASDTFYLGIAASLIRSKVPKCFVEINAA